MITLNATERALLSFGLSRLLTKDPSDGGNIEINSEFYTFSASRDALSQVVTSLGSEAPLKFNRRALRVIESYLNLTAATLSVKVIPEYEARMRKPGADKTSLKEYQIDAKNKVAVIAGLQTKVQKELLRA